MATPLLLPEAVTAVAGCTHEILTDFYTLAVGLENGQIHILRHASTGGDFTSVSVLNNEQAHHSTVTRLQFCPSDPNLLASSAQDHSVKIYNLKPVLT